MTPSDLAAALRAGGSALMAEALAELVKTACECEPMAMLEFTEEMQRRAAAVPPANAPKPPESIGDVLYEADRKQTALAELRQVDGATGANADRDMVFGGGDSYLEAIGNAIDDDLGWDSDEDRERGDYPGRIRQVAETLRGWRTERDALTARLQQLTGELEGVREQALLNTASFERARDALTARVADLGSVIDALRGSEQSWIAAANDLSAELRKRDAVVEAARKYADVGGMAQLEALRKALSALDKPSKPEPAS